jgi:hypothetical protein
MLSLSLYWHIAIRPVFGQEGSIPYARMHAVLPVVVSYVWEGFWRVLVPPSPKSQNQLMGLFVDESVKVTWQGAAPKAGDAEKLAVGMPSRCIIASIVFSSSPPRAPQYKSPHLGSKGKIHLFPLFV